MALNTVDQYGAPKYGPIGRPPAGVVFHTPEWGSTPALQGAIDCAKWQATSGNTSGGSYHGIIGHGGQHTDSMATCTNPDHWVMVRSVPWDQAAGGLSGNHTPPPTGVWHPERFPWIQQWISPAAFADPNRWFHQISLAGSAAWYVANGYPVGLLNALAQWVLTLEKAYGYDAVMTLHRHWQTNRSDPGPDTLADLIMVQYERLTAPPPAPAPPPVDPNIARVAKKNEHFDAAGAAATKLENAFDEGIKAIRDQLSAGRNV